MAGRLEDDEWQGRRVAMEALKPGAAMGNSRVLSLVEPLLEDEREDIRLCAAEVLGIELPEFESEGVATMSPCAAAMAVGSGYNVAAAVAGSRASTAASGGPVH